jgi:hypothetical protein
VKMVTANLRQGRSVSPEGRRAHISQARLVAGGARAAGAGRSFERIKPAFNVNLLM